LETTCVPVERRGACLRGPGPADPIVLGPCVTPKTCGLFGQSVWPPRFHPAVLDLGLREPADCRLAPERPERAAGPQNIADGDHEDPQRPAVALSRIADTIMIRKVTDAMTSVVGLLRGYGGLVGLGGQYLLKATLAGRATERTRRSE